MNLFQRLLNHRRNSEFERRRRRYYRDFVWREKRVVSYYERLARDQRELYDLTGDGEFQHSAEAAEKRVQLFSPKEKRCRVWRICGDPRYQKLSDEVDKMTAILANLYKEVSRGQERATE